MKAGRACALYGALIVSLAASEAIEAIEDDAMDMDGMEHDMAMHGMYGGYAMTRESSGTSWQPEATPMAGLHGMGESWSWMWHGSAEAIYDRQGGPRGDEKTFSESMAGVMAQRDLSGGTLGLRGMVSLDPLMGRRGYPLLFQTGESADGRTPLIDRQHPHDAVMELAASYSHALSDTSSVFGYAGLPGEPALGPPAYMHRFSGMDNPEAPLTHHWFDATHVTFGVVTAGLIWRDFKVEGSVFNGREPDENRWNIETRRLASSSARLSWNPASAWSLQISRGWLDSPELLEPGIDVRRTTASVSYQCDVAGNPLQTMLAWGRNDKRTGGTTDGWLLESEWRPGEKWTAFGRLEHVDKDELFEEADPRKFAVSKASVGAVYDFSSVGPGGLGLGGLVSGYAIPSALKEAYGANPTSLMIFLRARLE